MNLSLFSIKSSLQKLDCKNSKNSIESVDRPISFTLLQIVCFDLPKKIQVVLVPHAYLFSIKFLLALG